MKMSELVAKAILDMLESSDGAAEIQRNELAASLGCVPSQINYVLTSRFTPEQGYIVESRRGGGGYIRITRVRMDKGATLMHIINCIGEAIDSLSVRAILRDLIMRGFTDEKTGRLILAACSDSSYREIPVELRDRVRAAVFKNMLINLA